MIDFMRRNFRGILVLLGMVVAASGSLYSQLSVRATDDMTRQADVVAVGRVVALKSEWNQDRTRIYTKVTLSVNEYLKGDGQGGQLTIMTLGGEVDGIGELYTHTPTFRENEEVIVFARKEGTNRYRVSGGVKGKLLVTKDEATGKEIVANYRTLDDFAGQIRRAVKAHERGE